ncbi:LON peptidase substrate-binding domain-containing protein [Rickettsiales bacterium]|nr:LON peptidase substrate-binding domain-containing protein [Rickettsiales bacterium]
MIKNPFDISFNNLPESLPIYDVRSELLLPGGQIPLHIFEVKYLNMIQDALAAKDRMIGIVLPKSDNSKGMYDIGCAGRITSFEETTDGRFLITLTGYCRFHLKDAIPSIRGYKRYSVDWSNYKNDLYIDPNSDIDRDGLISILIDYSEALSIDMDWHVLSQVPNFNLITFFAMSLPFDIKDKQILLSAHTAEERADVLIAMIKDAMKNKDADRN